MKRIEKSYVDRNQLPCYGEYEYVDRDISIILSESSDREMTSIIEFTHPETGISINRKYIKVSDSPYTCDEPLALRGENGSDDTYYVVMPFDPDTGENSYDTGYTMSAVFNLFMTVDYVTSSAISETSFRTPAEFVTFSDPYADYACDFVISVFEDQTDIEFKNGSVLTFSKGIWFAIDYVDNVYCCELYCRQRQGEVKLLDPFYVSSKPGLVVTGKQYIINDDETNEDISVRAEQYAEVFNDTENNEAIGFCSHAEGSYTSAIANCSHTEGEGSRVEINAYAAHAEGGYTQAIGQYSHAEGYSTSAIGDKSHAEGYGTQSGGGCSHTEGYNTIVGENCFCQHVQGKYNIEDTEGKYAHIVGNGDQSADTNWELKRSNAHTLDWEGNAWFAGNVTIEGAPSKGNDLVTKEFMESPKDNIKMKDHVTGWTYSLYMDNGLIKSNLDPISMSISVQPNKMEYIDGEVIDLTGMEILLTYPDGTTETTNNIDDIVSIYEHADKNNSVLILMNKYGHQCLLKITVNDFDPSIILKDFTYTENSDGTYTINSWLQTLDGVSSTECVIPNNSKIKL